MRFLNYAAVAAILLLPACQTMTKDEINSSKNTTGFIENDIQNTKKKIGNIKGLNNLVKGKKRFVKGGTKSKGAKTKFVKNKPNKTIFSLLLAGAKKNETNKNVKSKAKVRTKPVKVKLKRSGNKTQNLATQIARQHGVPERLAHAVIQVESNWNPRATGRVGEVGLMQIKPATARSIGYRGATRRLYDPKTNLTWGMQYLAKAHQLGGGSTCGTILKYNAGHYAKRMNPISRRYCAKVKRILSGKSG